MKSYIGKLFFVMIVFLMVTATICNVALADDENTKIGEYTILSEDNADYEYSDGIIKLKSGTLKLTGEGTEPIEVDGNATLILSDIKIVSSKNAAVTVKAGSKGTVTLEGLNELTGANGYAALESEFEENNYATMIINGDGKLHATGGQKGAGIGGSGAKASVSGDVIIESGEIVAVGGNGAAGIGTAANNQGSHASYKLNVGEYGKITINGGKITADGYGGGAGIGGGNHVDGRVTINGGVIEHAIGRNGGAGIGAGCGSSKSESGRKGPGYYFAEVVVNGGTIKNAESEWLGAGIGGGYCSDAKITINGGTIISAKGGNGNSGSNYQGGAGIGGGYQGLAQIIITDGVVKDAVGGTASAGIGYGAAPLSSKRNGEPTISNDDQIINISGGTFENIQGGDGGSGIGSGNGCEKCTIVISGGNFSQIKGYTTNEGALIGGAGIGSGVGSNNESISKYTADTELDITITGGKFDAIIGGWGAAGIGSGAGNKVPENIDIDSNKTNAIIYSDGVNKPAIENSGTCNYEGTILQSTFSDLVDTSVETSFRVINSNNSSETYNLDMPIRYKSFAVLTRKVSDYVVKGESSYFSTKSTIDTEIGDDASTDPKLQTYDGEIALYNYLYPVSTIPEIKDEEEPNTDQEDNTKNTPSEGDTDKEEEVNDQAKVEEKPKDDVNGNRLSDENKKNNDQKNNPKTGDNIIAYLVIFITSLVVIKFLIKKVWKNGKRVKK